jgi:hypothetical protein
MDVVGFHVGHSSNESGPDLIANVPTVGGSPCGERRESGTAPLRTRDRWYALITKALAVSLLPAAFVRRPRRARALACHWALSLRFPTENLTGLTTHARAAFTAARADAFWRHGQLIGLTSGYRDPGSQQQLFDREVHRRGSLVSAREFVLPPAESTHILGIALDVRPREGARWLEEHGARYDLHRIYDNEWWHFEYRPEFRGRTRRRLPYPGVAPGPEATTRLFRPVRG